MQPAGTGSVARRATAGLTVICVSRERNNADGHVLAGPKGAHQTGQSGVAILGKGAPFPADCALLCPVWWTLHPKLSPGWSTSDIFYLFRKVAFVQTAFSSRLHTVHLNHRK